MATSTSTTTTSNTSTNTSGSANINTNTDISTATTTTTIGGDGGGGGPTTSTIIKPEVATNSTNVNSSNLASNNLASLPSSNNIKATSSTGNNNNIININPNKNQATNGSFSDSYTSTEGHRTPNVENLSKTNLYIRGLSANTSDQDLYNMCAKFGNIFSTKAIQDKVNGGCKGYGFVQFTSPQSAELAVQELTKTGIQAQMARISSGNSSHNNHHHHHHHHHNNHHHHHPHNNHYNQNQGTHHQHNSQHHNNSNNHNNNPHSQSHSHNSSSNSNNHSNSNNADPTNLYIANLPLTMTEQELENLLSGFGPVVSTRILRDPNTNSGRGVGFARMESRDKCQEIIDKLNGKPFRGSKEHLLVKFADGGIKKRHHHNNHHNNNNNNFQQHHKVSQDENRWRGNTNVVNDLNNLSNFEQGNISHGNQLPDLAIMSTLSYPRLQPSFPPPVGPASAYNPAIDPSTGGQQWIHPATGQPWNMIPQQMIHSGGMNPSSQAAAGFPFAHISQLTSQMQGLQLAHHPGAPVGGYLPPHHQWPGMWPHAMTQQQHQQHHQQPHQRQQHQQQQQPQPTSMRMAGPIQQQPPQAQQKQHSSPSNPQQQSATVSESPASQKQQNQVGSESKLQIPTPL